MKRLVSLIVLLFVNFFCWTQASFPKNDLDFNKAACYAFINATLVKDGLTTILNGTLIIRSGKIEAIGQQVPIPPDAQIVDCKGKYIYPSFIDAYSDYGMPSVSRPTGRGFGAGPAQMTTDVKYAAGWNAAIKAEQDAVKLFQVNEIKAKELRASGFGIVNSHMMDGIIRGTSTVVTLANVNENLVILKDKASMHFSFSKGSSMQDYPTSLMGSIALLRQTFLDGLWYKTKPPLEGTNLTLGAFNEALSLPLIFEAGDKWNDLRANKVGKEFGASFIIVAGVNEYQRIGEIKNTGATYIVPLNFPNALDVEDPNDARLVALSDMQHWELAPSNPAAFEKAGIRMALTMYGLRDVSSFMVNLKKAIQYGLSEAKALDALTKTPAMILGISDKVGTLDPGKLANFIITTGALFKEKTTIYENWIHGTPYILKSDEGSDHSSTYDLIINKEKYRLSLRGDNPLKLTAQIIGQDTTQAECKLNERLVTITFSHKKDSGKINTLSGVMIGDIWNGTGLLAQGQMVRWTATPTKGDSIKVEPGRREPNKKSLDLGKVRYPFQGYGWTEPPALGDILIKNTTVWTSAKDGVLHNADVLLQGGKIVKIGKGLISTGAKNIDGSGKHLTAGIIDEHSHIAATGSINECSQSVTAEVRIQDVLNPDDINMYRQLSGGVTAVHILHGSCNTIGGQTQLIKLRWGKNAEDLKFGGWPGFIKFALGENVKRASNSQNNRFPDTRMGVEQLLEDAFLRARQYERAPAPKRRDLELDAILEVMNQKRFITCHSYVATEIMALMTVAEKYNIKVNTFTHILEGYKVADLMKKHGAAASSFSDWWAYKAEVQDAIPQSPYIMDKLGLNVAINSDDAEMARRLNQEAAKSIRYADMDEIAALNMITINPATMLHISDRTGSIEVGKDADVVLWSDHPLSIYAKAEKTIVDGIIYFDRDKDLESQKSIASEKSRLVQKMISAKKGGDRTDIAVPAMQEEAMCDEDHNHTKSIWHRIEQRIIEQK